jgi:S1-C subfamily serine protease
MRQRRRFGLGTLVAVSLAAAVLGGGLVLLAGRTSGWLGGGETVVLERAPAVSADAEATAFSDAKPLQGNTFDPAAIYRRRSVGVVTIYSLFPGHADGATNAQAQGSGFVVSPDGYVLTNSHVITTAGEETASEAVTAAETVYVEFPDGERVSARVVGWDLFSDVGLLQVDPEEHALRPVPLGDSSTVAVGEPVAAIGSPFGQAGSLAVGVVSAIHRAVESLTSEYNVIDAIQTDAPINRGNSGGPLFNARGEVIGINAQIRSESGNAEGVGFAIPINTARRSMEQLIETGRVRYAWVGVQTRTLTDTLAEALGYGEARGAVVEGVVSGSPAEQAGIRGGSEPKTVQGEEFIAGGDLIVAVDGREVESTEELIRIVTGELFPGQTARVTVLREGRLLALDVVLADRPLSPDVAR